jgi:hypothetical protein
MHPHFHEHAGQRHHHEHIHCRPVRREPATRFNDGLGCAVHDTPWPCPRQADRHEHSNQTYLRPHV